MFKSQTLGYSQNLGFYLLVSHSLLGSDPWLVLVLMDLALSSCVDSILANPSNPERSKMFVPTVWVSDVWLFTVFRGLILGYSQYLQI